MSDSPSNGRVRQRPKLAQSRSVTKNDIIPIGEGGRIFQIFVPSVMRTTSLPDTLPIETRSADRILDSTPRFDAEWGAAIGIAITKIASLAWDVKSESDIRAKRAHELLLDADKGAGQGGWLQFIAKQVRNYLTTRNGCFFEIEREVDGPYMNRIVGIHHLSALRCRRTADPDFPVVYLDRKGVEHVMNWYDVVAFNHLPDGDDWGTGIGLPPAEIAYPQIIKMAALERYVYEKISGRRPLAIHIVNGMRTEQLQDVIAGADAQRERKGMTNYMGAIVVATLKPTDAPSVATIPLAELPDGFNAEQERARADQIYANAIGFDPQELRAISNQQMGAGAQSAVLDQKAKGRGLSYYRLQLVHALNEMALDRVEFIYTERDLKDQLSQAQVNAARIDNVVKLLAPPSGGGAPPGGGTAPPGGGPKPEAILTIDQARQMLVDQDVLSQDIIPQDRTPTTTIGDIDNPDSRPDQTSPAPQATFHLFPLQPRPIVRTKETVPVRVVPHIQGRLVELLGPTDDCIALQTTEDRRWIQVVTKEGRSGWVSTTYVEPLRSSDLSSATRALSESLLSDQEIDHAVDELRLP